MKKLLAALVLLLALLFLLTRIDELQDVVEVLQRGSLLFLSLALFGEAAWLFNLSGFYQALYQALGMQEKRSALLKLGMAANFLTVVAPSAGLSAIAVFVADARRNGRSTARATVVCVLYVWFEYVSTLLTLFIGFAVLVRRNNLQWPEITAASMLLAAALGVSLALYLSMRSASALGSALTWLFRLINRLLHPFTHREVLSVDQGRAFATELGEGIAVLRHRPRWVVKPLLFAMLNKCFLFVVLMFCFMAFEIEIDPGTIVSGLSVAQLFLIISPTPAGMGIVEGILPFTLNRLGVPLGSAAVVTLAYRGFTFWVPLFVGMIAFRMLSRQAKTAQASTPIESTSPSGGQDG